MIRTIENTVTAEPLVTEAIAGIYRVEAAGQTIGYVQLTGERYVSLLGPVYNTSVEVAQTLTLEAAVHRLQLQPA
jgi:hypothetical protein